MKRCRPSRDQARVAVIQWLDTVRSSISALVGTLDATLDELQKPRSPICGMLSASQIRGLLMELQNLECAANCLSLSNPLDLSIPCPLELLARQSKRPVPSPK